MTKTFTVTLLKVPIDFIVDFVMDDNGFIVSWTLQDPKPRLWIGPDEHETLSTIINRWLMDFNTAVVRKLPHSS